MESDIIIIIINIIMVIHHNYFKLYDFNLNHFDKAPTYHAGTNLIIVCISIILGIINARVLQAEGKGTFAVYMSVYSIIYALTNLGVRQSSSYYFSKENMDIRDIFGVHAISIFLGFFITTTSLLLIFFYLEILNINIFVCFVFIVPLALYTTYTTSFALSNKWIERLNIVN